MSSICVCVCISACLCVYVCVGVYRCVYMCVLRQGLDKHLEKVEEEKKNMTVSLKRGYCSLYIYPFLITLVIIMTIFI